MMDTAMAASAVGGSVVGAAVHFSRVTTDTRALAPGDLFVALKGERFDGHDFVAHALASGAAAALVADSRAASLDGNLIAVAEKDKIDLANLARGNYVFRIRGSVTKPVDFTIKCEQDD